MPGGVLPLQWSRVEGVQRPVSRMGWWHSCFSEQQCSCWLFLCQFDVCMCVRVCCVVTLLYKWGQRLFLSGALDVMWVISCGRQAQRPLLMAM